MAGDAITQRTHKSLASTPQRRQPWQHLEDVDTPCGKIDEAIEPDQAYEFDHEDNRDNPPDNGTLIQLGGSGDSHDYVRLSTNKMPLLGLPEESNKKQKSDEHKKQKVDRCDDDSDDESYDG